MAISLKIVDKRLVGFVLTESYPQFFQAVSQIFRFPKVFLFVRVGVVPLFLSRGVTTQVTASLNHR
jgi:hypothetical protein